MQSLVSSLSHSNYSINVGVLQTAHSIFQPWRAATRSDRLFTNINYVLGRFCEPFLQLFNHTAGILFSGTAPPDPNSPLDLVAQAQVLLVDIFYDLTCQDLPPAIEDAHARFFNPPDGVLLQFLSWDPDSLRGDVSASCE